MSQTDSTLSPLKHSRSEKILDVGERLFSQQGFRATTMEGIAAEVGMSKVTVYGYFRDKECLFQAVASRLAGRAKQVVEEALRTDENLSEQIISALIAKHQLIFDLVRQSDFASELFEAKDQFASAVFKETDAEIETLIASAIEHNGASPVQSNAMARLLFGASTGIANHSQDFSEMTKNIDLLVRGVLQAKGFE